MSNKRQAGVTLVELIIAIVIIGVGLAGVVAALARASINSALPIQTKHMAALAEGMMEEIQLRQFSATPDVFTANSPCARNHFNDVKDYHNYSQSAICDIDGNSLPQFAGYSVSVTVTNVPNAHVMTSNNVPANDAVAITIQVTNSGAVHELRGWRTNY